MLTRRIAQASSERNIEQTTRLKIILSSKINIPSSNMMSKAGRFFNHRNIDYAIIHAQGNETQNEECFQRSNG